MTRLYLCGPMTGHPAFNYPEFHNVAAQLRMRGYEVENPAENSAPPCGSYVGWMRMAIKQVVTCDGLAYLDGWETSKGALIEIRLARDLDMPVKAWSAWA